VRIIRPKNLEDEAGFGYVVGLHEKLTGKAALVWVIDERNSKWICRNRTCRSRNTLGSGQPAVDARV